MPGLTAWVGLVDVGRVREGEALWVSGAAGAVGSIAAQIAKLKGLRVIGSAGSPDKVEWLESLGIEAYDYNVTPARDALVDGIDAYFDNVGGAITDAVVQLINTRARIAICGQSSQYNLEEPEVGPRWLGRLIVKEAKVQGFLVGSYAARFPEAREQMDGWLKRGKLKYREDVAQGIEAAPQAFIAMLQGHNHGKQLVQLSAM
jgi:NADPH-dependent curcumin reductase CurA